MRIALPLLLSAVASLPLHARAQAPDGPADLRLVDWATEPERPAFGEPFDLRVTVRVGPGTVVFLPDTLPPAEAAQSAGPGAWQAARTTGDSVEVTARYPVIGYVEGRMDLPEIELWLRRGGPGGDSLARGASDAAALDDRDRRLLRLGAVMVAPYAAMADSGALLVPRPAAGVMGGEWSLWLILAVGVASTAGLGGAGMLVTRWWNATGAALFSRARGRTPRQDALRELERIRALGWHRNGRVDEFYASSTDTLRHYAGQVDPAWGAALTSMELLARLEERWGPVRAQGLAPAIEVAERVKFGSDRPGPDAAEADWAAIRDWIKSAPEG